MRERRALRVNVLSPFEDMETATPERRLELEQAWLEVGREIERIAREVEELPRGFVL